MLRGDLDREPLAGLLRRLAAAGATGCVYVRGRQHHGPEARVALRGGEVSNVVVPGHEDAVVERLLATGHLTADALAGAREAQLAAPEECAVPDLLIQLGLVDAQLVATLVLEQALADLTLLCGWTEGAWRFRRREPSGPALPTSLPVAELLAAVEERHSEWNALLPTVGGADAVVTLAPSTAAPDGSSLELSAAEYALLCAVDGVRTVDELAAAVGSTVLDTARAVARLVQAGLAHTEPATSADPGLQAPGDDRDADDVLVSPLAAIADVFARRDAPSPLFAEGDGSPADDSLTVALGRASTALTRALAQPAVVLPGSGAADRRTSAALLLSQLADEPATPVEPPRQEPPAAPPGRVAEPRPQPAVPVRQTLTDTAALMRELSSLGIDDSAAVQVPRTAASASARERERERLASQQARKRKGIFGRG